VGCAPWLDGSRTGIRGSRHVSASGGALRSADRLRSPKLASHRNRGEGTRQRLAAAAIEADDLSSV